MDPDEMLKKPGDPTGANPEEDPATVAARAQRAETLLWLRGQAANASYIPDTLAERYLVEHRGLAGSPRGRWHCAISMTIKPLRTGLLIRVCWR